MLGKYNILISNNRVSYSIDLSRKITIIKGKSGSGKTTFVSMVRDWLNNGRKSGIKCKSNANLIVLDNSSNWGTLLKNIKGSIFIADEGIDYITLKDFGDTVNNSDNYFLFITRSGSLWNMTYSVESILELRTEKSGRMFYTSSYPHYFDRDTRTKPDLLITEDSNSGMDMMKCLLKHTPIMSGRGRDNVINVYLKEMSNYKNIVILVDGAAFGGSIAKFNGYLDDVFIVAPESFEYLLLHLDFIYKYVRNEVDNTVEYCNFDSDIISYERYYTKLLSDVLREKFNKVYRKSKLLEFFVNDNVFTKMKILINDIDFSE